ncbi:thioredoxin family protein [Sulfurimonas sp.]|uniref:thioredoxin family protein n=1 Tax=Sulfurimonas sp. TaxID=2022749 RepID=UPI003561C39A
MAQFNVDEESFQVVMDGELGKGKIVIVKFGSEFCEACSALEMELDQLEDINNNVSILLVDCDESPEIAEAYDVYQLPTMIIFENKDNILYEAEGVVLSEDIQKIIESKL